MNFWQRLMFEWKYLSKPPWDSGITPPELVALTKDHQPGRALDLGCGTGTNSIYLAQHGWEVIGVDFAWQAIRKARRKASRFNINIDFHQGDVSNLSGIKGVFDLLLDIGCFHSLPKDAMRRYLENVPRLLSQTGIFLLYAFIKENNDERGLSAENLDWMKNSLTLVHMEMGIDCGRPSAWFRWQLPPERPES